ncbi:hypothetical protein HK099_002885 [Clydaea vesicula]|uniref:Glycoside hydrolase family 5 protein n=1 Tax=Clydaea vesicula TaxID=447962 RepID=A0AAD5XZJ7_9FUNG|nr:hypothetical protein HK099_002885 [Clydaea vesicula]KAJ3397032.1 hypothetical protein HDU92_001045 [Lobulomyces angularis]
MVEQVIEDPHHDFSSEGWKKRDQNEFIKTRAQHWSGKLHTKKNQFVDNYGRVLHLRGVNLCGNSKLPVTDNGFFNHKNVSFINRPFPLNKADEHFSRLRAWGLTFVRLLVPWEALEHDGPGIYDEKFIDYLIKILEKAKEYGIQAFIDPHQDTWSRFSGGSGAPGWCFEVCGMDLTKFKECGAAHIHELIPGESEESNIALWATNYTKLASATMFTLFFAGNTFAPESRYNGQTLQDFLQSSFIKCYMHLAKRLMHLDSVVGFEVLNEPHAGYIGLPRISQHFDQNSNLNLGQSPSALQSFALGEGMTQECEFWVKSWPRPSRRSGTCIINQEKATVWLNKECIWKKHGVWGLNENGFPVAFKDDYFCKHPATSKPVDFMQDFYMPFIKSYASAIRSVDSSLYIFFEPIPNEYPPVVSKEMDDENYVYAPHWYDLKTMFTKSFDGFITHDVQGLSKGTKNILTATYLGLGGANENYKYQISNIVKIGIKNVGMKPLLIGECGCPMDINDRQAFQTGDYSHHNNFLDAVINAMEANFVNFTLWNYNPDNDNTHGDHWNGEDFSIYSPKPSRSIEKKVKAKSNLNTPNELKRNKLSLEALRTPLIIPQQILSDTARLSGMSTNPTTSNHSGQVSLSPVTPMTPFDITSAYFNMEGDRDHHHHIGGRALDAIIRVYAAKIAGDPLLMKFDLQTLSFKLEFATKVDSDFDRHPKTYISEIFIPNYHYGGVKGVQILVSDGEFCYDREKQTLYWNYDPNYMGIVKNNSVIHSMKIYVPELEKKDVWGWLAGIGIAVGLVAVGFALAKLTFDLF